MNSWPASTPVISDEFSEIYERIKEFKLEFKNRFILDHNFAGELDTTDIDCDGYHNKVTFPHWNAEDYELEYPVKPDDSVVFFAKKFSTSATAQFTSGSADITLTVTAASLGLVVGMLIEGDSNYISDGTFVSSINGSVVTMSQVAKASIAALLMAFSTIELCCYKDDGKYQITENGSVKRGICEEENNYLTKITESKVEKINNEIICTPLDGRPSFKVPYYETVSMNMFGFTSSIFDYLEKDFPKFLDENISNLTSEYLIPDVIFDMIKKELIKM